MENINNISFEINSNKFVIEDTFYKLSYKLPKTLDQIIFFSNKKNDESFSHSVKSLENQIMKDKINYAINEIKEHKKINRIDGILFLKKTNQLIILTEFYIFEFIYENEAFFLSRIISITSIDYITLTRNGKKMILHLIQNQNQINNNKNPSTNANNNNLENDSNFFNNNCNDNFVLNYKQLEKIVGCIAATYFYDKQEFELKKEFTNRQISVIMINENFEIVKELEKIKNFEEYR
jgi:hypothetical protein